MLRHALLAALTVAGCTRSGAIDREGRAAPGGEVARDGPPSFVVEGLVVWPEPIERAPAWVRDYWGYAELVFETVDGAPLPPPSTGAENARTVWQRDIYDPYWTDARATLDPRAIELARTREEAYAAIADVGMFENVVVLLIQEHLVRHLVTAGFEPRTAGCGDASPRGALARALRDCADHARRCTDMAARTSTPFRENGAECQRRGAACRVRLDRAEHDPHPCNPQIPGD